MIMVFAEEEAFSTLGKELQLGIDQPSGDHPAEKKEIVRYKNMEFGGSKGYLQDSAKHHEANLKT